MRSKVALVLLGVAATAVLVVVNPFGHRDGRIGPIEESRDGEVPASPRAPVSIEGAPASRTPESGADPASTSAGPTDEGPALHGIVVDSATGLAIANAAVEASPARFEFSVLPRPRRPVGTTPEPRTTGPVARSTSSPTGRFSIPWSADHPADLWAFALGHLDESRNSVSVDDDLRISLRAGTPIRGRAHRSDGVAIEGAVVRADSIPKDVTEHGGHVSSTTRTDGSGSFEVLGLPGVLSGIVVTHPDYMPASARATPETNPVDLAMVPALRVWFRLHASDRGPMSAPVIQWNRTSSVGSPIGVGVVDLSMEARETDVERSRLAHNENDGFGPVKVPCAPPDGVVRFTVRDVGRLPWISEDIAVPAGGGERIVDATLERDPSVGSITVRLRDPDGHDLAFKAGESVVSVRRTDGPALIGRAVERSGYVVFEGLVAGMYEVFATARRFGSATATAQVEGGRELPVDVALSAASALRVRIDAGPKRRVHFQLLRTGTAIAAFEDPSPKDVADPDRNVTHFFAGSEGTLLRGLGAGRYVVRVLSPDLVAPDTDVELPVGATAEITIQTKAR